MGEWHIAAFINDHRLVAGDLTLQTEGPLLFTGLDQCVAQGKPVVMKPTERFVLSGGHSHPEGICVLPVPLLPTAMMVS